MRSRLFAVLVVSLSAALGLVAPLAAADDDAALIAMERAFWEGWKTHDSAPFQEHLAEGTINTTAAGRDVGKAASVAMIASDRCKVNGYSLGEIAVHRFGEHTAILTYDATQDAVCNGAKLAEKVLVTSVWVKTDGKWQAASYQESPAPAPSP